MNNTKTLRKNKKNQDISWPTLPYFTIDELHEVNDKFVEITLRVRLNKFIENGSVVCIGQLTGGTGRPKKVFAVTPVTQKMLDTAKNNGVILSEKVDLLVKAVQVNKTSTSSGVSSLVKTAEPVKYA